MRNGDTSIFLLGIFASHLSCPCFPIVFESVLAGLNEEIRDCPTGVTRNQQGGPRTASKNHMDRATQAKPLSRGW